METLVTEYGHAAVEMLVEEIAVAVRAGDDARVDVLDRQLRHAEQLLADSARQG